jgi:RND family efflux transporter MFP subunit
MSTPSNAPRPDLSSLRIDSTARGSRISWVRWIPIFFLVLIVLVAAGFMLRSRTPIVEIATVRTAKAGERATLLNASGYVTPRRRATIAAKITARVDVLNVDEGMRVKEGQVLALLDESDARVRLNSAKADREATSAALADLRVNLANAERDLYRTQGLKEGGVTSQQALDTARTLVESYRARIASTEGQVQAADARISTAQQDLDNCVVRAPFPGIIVSKDAQVGEMVSPVSAGGGFTRTGIATIVDMNSIEIEVDVNESYIARVQIGQPVIAVLDAYPDWQIPAKVRTIIPTADRQKATVKVRIAFDKLDPRILPDMGVKVSFLDEEKKPANAAATLTVPKSALRTSDGAQVLFVYRNGVVERRAVRLGNAHDNDQEIIAGLNDGDQVVVRGAENLRDGAKVEVKQ